MIYEARANFADEKPIHVYTEEQFKDSYNRVQRDNIRRALGQEKSRYGFYWNLGDEKTTQGGNEKTTESGDEKTTESGNPIEMLTSDIPYTSEDVVDMKEYLIFALRPEFERMGGGWFISGKTLRKFITEEGIEEMERRHCIEGYHVYDTYEEAREKVAAKAPPNYYRLGWELRNLLMGYDADIDVNAYSFNKYWNRCNLDKKENIS